MSGTEVRPPYGDFWAGRGFLVARQIEEALDGANWAGKDISSSRWVYRIRAFNENASPTVLVYDKPIDKSATGQTDGWLHYYFPLGTTTYSVLRWELVEVDTSNTDSATPTTKLETVLEYWYQDVKAKPPV